MSNFKNINNPIKIIEKLKKLKANIIKNESKIIDALYNDLNKSDKESFLSEISEVTSEIDYHIKNLRKWYKVIKVKPTYQTMNTKSYLVRKPKGNVLIISPFNYPFNLLMMPLIGAISGGNKVWLKMSPHTLETNKVISEIIKKTFTTNEVDILKERNLKTYDDIYDMGFDMIFFTGSTKVGKIIAQKCAAKNIEFVTELGGKCSCIVDEIINDSVYDRIVWAKFINAGQTCVSINHIFYNMKIKDFDNKLIESIKKQYPNPIENKNIPKIINKNEFDRLTHIIKKYKDNIIFGGNYDAITRIIEPTIIKVKTITPIKELPEIFGPILFIVEAKNSSTMIEMSNEIDRSPLASYYYGKDNSNIEKFFKHINAGGYCVNDSLTHILNHNLPFGGVKTSGFGKYHGKYSFESFTNLKPILINNARKNNPIKFFNNHIDKNKANKMINFIRKFVE